MILIDWKKIISETSGKRKPTIDLLAMIATNGVPRNRRDPMYKYSKMDFKGTDFLSSPLHFLAHQHEYSWLEVKQYMALASKRRLAEFLLTGDLTLDLNETLVDINKIKDNRLLLIDKDGIVHFMYEKKSDSK